MLPSMFPFQMISLLKMVSNRVTSHHQLCSPYTTLRRFKIKSKNVLSLIRELPYADDADFEEDMQTLMG